MSSQHSIALCAAKNYLVASFGKDKGTMAFSSGDGIRDLGARVAHFTQMISMLEASRSGKPYEGKVLELYKHEPVSVRQFVEDPYFLDAKGILYPEVLRCTAELNSGAYVEAVLTGCVDADTEYLTPTGWERIATYSGGVVAQYQNGFANFVNPEFIKLPCSEFYELKSRYGVDQRLSGDHRVWYRPRKSAKYEFILAKDLAALHNKNKIGWEGKMQTVFCPMVSTELPWTDAELRLLVASMADGSFPAGKEHQPKGGRLCTISVVKERKKTRLRELLAAAGVEWKEKIVPSRSSYTRFVFRAPARVKVFDAPFWKASVAQLKIIVDEVFKWDGSVRESNSRFFSVHKQSADFIQYALAAVGVRSVLSVDANTRGFKPNGPLYIVSTSSNVEVGISGVPKTPIGKVQSVDGFKYCFSVPSGLLVLRRNGRIFITGNSIGSGKTTVALFTTAYQLYVLSCMRNPHAVFGLDPNSEIMFIFQSINAKLAKSVDYARFRSMIARSPYFKELFPFNSDLESEMIFPNRIKACPISGEETGAIGQNIVGGIIDEMNFMAVIENSKISSDGGTYDQAMALYHSIARRRKSRFMKQGKLPGMLCLVSSKRYPGQFTDLKEAEARREVELYGKTSIYVYDKRTWDIKPPGAFSEESFKIFIGDAWRMPRILKEGELIPVEDEHLVDTIPEDYRLDFESDIMNALRDIAGVSTLATHPFIVDRESIGRCTRTDHVCFSQEAVDFVDTKLQIDKSQFKNPELLRFVHLDLAVSGDSAGMAIGTVTGFTHVGEAGCIEVMPIIWVDAVLEIKPPRNGEILLYKVREVIYALSKLGLNIKWVTCDTYQSIDTLQLMRQHGYTVGTQSVDVTTSPYDFTKNALYSGRLSLPPHAKLQLELASLEKDVKANKVDHSPTGSKDCADGLAGMVYGLTMRREVWAMHGIPLGSIPESVLASLKKDKVTTEGTGRAT